MASAPATVDLTTATGSVSISAGTRHRVGAELKTAGNSVVPGPTRQITCVMVQFTRGSVASPAAANR